MYRPASWSAEDDSRTPDTDEPVDHRRGLDYHEASPLGSLREGIMSRTFRIAVIEGDGIGPEVTREAIRAVEATAPRSSARVEWTKYQAETWER